MALAVTVISACTPSVPQLGEASIDDVIGAMTVEEKVHLIVGTGMDGFSGDSAVIGETRGRKEERNQECGLCGLRRRHLRGVSLL